MNIEKLRSIISGEVDTSAEAIQKYSKDASLFTVQPEMVVFPKDVKDLEHIVSFVYEEKKNSPSLSITGRSAGSDMTGGPLNESIILDFTKYFKHIDINTEKLQATIEPGVFYRDFEKVASPLGVEYPIYPASKQLAAFGGIVMNNSAGEKTLRYGQARDFVEEVSIVLSDGKEHTFKPITLHELNEKMQGSNYESETYRKVYTLINDNYDVIKAAEPNVHKNSAGYALWRVLDKEKGIFDMTQLFVGSQGTLGLLTKAKVRVMKHKPHKKMVVIFFKSWDNLPQVVNEILPFQPESLETFDDQTLTLGMRFMPEIAKKVGQNFFRFALRFIPETLIGIRMLRLPKLIMLVEIAEEDEELASKKTREIYNVVQKHNGTYPRILKDSRDQEKYWIMRRESFNLLRQHVKGKRTAPFVEDFCINPEKMPEFLPKLLHILKKSGIKANIAGHAGDGNYHIIPLMDLTKESERKKIVPVADEVFTLIKEFGGTITAEHNDGIIRTPYLEQMFGTKIYSLFIEIKKIFDPENIFNPGKKVGGSKEYIEAHITRE
ncbi:MAG: FAD-binding oxidoreductase [Candidatus Taylorbacteria bacterium]|nr:FAD-binding oxidoreductase [Candidatus Taylorbacteria bacterium]